MLISLIAERAISETGSGNGSDIHTYGLVSICQNPPLRDSDKNYRSASPASLRLVYWEQKMDWPFKFSDVKWFLKHTPLWVLLLLVAMLLARFVMTALFHRFHG